MRGKDLPDPSWWRLAKRMHEESGMSYAEIARVLGKSGHAAVRYALCTKYREDSKQRSLRRYHRTGERGLRPDEKRHDIREEARRRWRSEGYAKSLETYYRELECL